MPQGSGAAKRRIDSSSALRTANPTAKRSRVSRACDQCRTAREKCDGQTICSSCAGAKRTCTYTANPKKRGIQPGYIRTLELALTWLFHTSDAESVLNKKLLQEGAASVLLGRDTKESNKLHKSWRRSKFCRDVDKLLSGEDIGEEDDRSPDSDDQDSDIDDRPRQSTSAPRAIDHGTIIQEPTQITTRDDPSPRQQPLTEATALPPDRWRLFDVYFAYTHCWFPVCEKHDILKLSYSYSENGLHLTSSMPDSGDHAELWSILALASLQDTSNDRDPSSSTDPQNGFSPKRIYDIARMLIPTESGLASLGHVKALLLLALFNITQSCPEAAWLMVGHASRLIIDLDQKKLTGASRFQHVFCGCFLLDHLISAQLQRPPYLQPSDIERVGKIHEDGLEEWQPWTGCSDSLSSSSQSRAPALSLSTFNRLVDLAGIMSLIKTSGSSQNNLQEAAARLQAWKLSLPPALQHINSEQLSVPSAPPALLIQVVYSCCCSALYSSQSWLQRMLEILERFQHSLGWYAMPPIIGCLLRMSEMQLASSAPAGGIQSRLGFFSTELSRAWSQKFGIPQDRYQPSPVLQRRTSTAGSVNTQSRPGFVSHQQIPTPESISQPINHLGTGSSAMDDVIPGIGPALLSHPPQPVAPMGYNPVRADLQNLRTSSYDNSFEPGGADWNPTETRNIESFFDDLASLDGAERVHQPQFMQNLGFAPDADIADFLTTDFGQLTSSMLPQYSQNNFQETPQLNEPQFFDGS